MDSTLSEDMFVLIVAIGQPVYNSSGALMGYLGVGLFDMLDYSMDIRIPCEYWEICLPTEDCIEGSLIYTYWQNKAKEAKRCRKL